MKNISLTVEFKNPEKELQEQLQRNGARNISIRRNFDGCLEVSYKIVCADPQKEIEKMLSSSGGQIMVQDLIWKLTIVLMKESSKSKL